MPKYRVSISYQINIFETYEVEFGKADDLLDDSLLEEFYESPYDFCCPENRTDKEEGDCVNDSWNETYKEINPLDRIVEALADHPIHLVACDDPYCIDGTSSEGRKDDGSKWEEGAHGDCENCDSTGKIPAEAISDDAA
jgi:hypothetical protein